MNIVDLPFELIVSIGNNLDSESDLNIFAQCSKQLFSALNRQLYYRNQTHFGNTALEWAAANGEIDTVNRALSYDLNLDDHRILRAAIIGCHIEIVRLVLESSETACREIDDIGIDGYTELYLASRAGDVDILRLLIEHGADISVFCDKNLISTPGSISQDDGSGNNAITPQVSVFYEAVLRGHIEVVKELLENGAVVDVEKTETHDRVVNPGFLGWPAVCIAAFHGHVEILEHLLDNGADINFATRAAATPLYLAVLKDETHCIDLLLDRGADMDKPTNEGVCPVGCAATMGYIHTLRLLLDRGARIDYPQDMDHPLFIACDEKKLDCAQLLLERGVDVCCGREPSDHWTPLHHAVHNDETETVRVLLQHIVSTDNQTVLQGDFIQRAIFRDYIETVHLFLQFGAPVNTWYKDKTPLHWAAGKGMAELCRLILERSADIDIKTTNATQVTALHLATINGDLDTVRILLAHGCDAEAGDINGQNALHFAAARKYLHIMTALTDHGVSITSKTNSGATPAHVAAMHGAVDALELIYQISSADINARDNNGRTPLYYAAMDGQISAVKFFLSKPRLDEQSERHSQPPQSLQHDENNDATDMALDAPIINGNEADVFGAYPVFAAVRKNHIEGASILLEANGSHVKQKDHFGRDLLWWARHSNDKDLIDLVQQYSLKFGAEPIEYDGQPYDPLRIGSQSRWCCRCDVCTIRDAHNTFHKMCEICDRGKFDICGDCRAAGAWCRDRSHALSKSSCPNNLAPEEP